MRHTYRSGRSRLLAMATIGSLVMLSTLLVAGPVMAQDGAALNIRTMDEQGVLLAGAVYSVEGIDGEFTSGEDGHFCITGLPANSEYLVTQIQAPTGYEIAEPPSQVVKVDNDGDCNSPDAEFIIRPVQPTPTPAGSEVANTPSPSPRGTVAGGNPTPSGPPALPDTAAGQGSTTWLAVALALTAIASLGALAWLRLSEARIRR